MSSELGQMLKDHSVGHPEVVEATWRSVGSHNLNLSKEFHIHEML